ncbi:FAD-dependent tricarballylate dehydrogenase TcuA [Rubrobacter calidifluminis]|uniref:FAD-dependent tricarballylate dehydrogenase TcuA n=1 Tax=Rubrobacter calidifluminis TaxID=1392640 RepID=UPI002362C5B7|nr:FAD-dependent tricarballylate dehydrogenase TcuA [Rubrobacter calidifluminis]
MRNRYDVVVVGGGNAAFCAAHAAREHAERVLLLEKAPKEWGGGNSYFTAGAFRTTYAGLDDLVPLLDEVDEERLARTELPPYGPEDFLEDLMRVTHGRSDKTLASILANDAREVVRWLKEKGIRWRLLYERQSYQVEGKHRFWGNLALGSVGGGKGLMYQHATAAERSGVEVRYGHAVRSLLPDGEGGVRGVVCRSDDEGEQEIEAGAVVLACGGFESDVRMRAQYLGPGWDLAKVRGTPYNTGDGLEMALKLGAQPYGHWSGCHSVAWDANAPEVGDLELTNLLTKQSYPLGIVVNAEGRRFIDEGADFRNYTYARYGAEILRQPGAIAYQLFDAKTEPLLRQDEYTAPGVSRYEARSVRELASKIGVDEEALARTVEEYNASIQPGEFNPAVKDGKRTRGIIPPKSNWALPLDTPPYLAFAVTCGITFTFGGLRIDEDGRVLDRGGRPMAGLFAAGELVGGLFYHNYPGGSGLTAGAVFGRRAGYAAARSVRG